MKVAVIGCGNVGFEHLHFLVRHGFDAIGFDISDEVKDKIDEMIGHQYVAKNINEIADCDSFHVCVPTEPNLDGTADMSIYNSVMYSLKELLRDKNNVSIIQRSTCPVGTAKHYTEFFGENISYGVNPSFLRKNRIFEDTEYPERVAIGGTGIAVEHLHRIYKHVSAPHFICDDCSTVELLKYVENTLDSVLISYWNEILAYAVKVGIKSKDYVKLLEAITDREKFRSTVRIPGKAFGLWCLPKDISALTLEMKKFGVKPNTIEGALNTNLEIECSFGIGTTPATELWSVDDNKSTVLPKGKEQIDNAFLSYSALNTD